MAFGDGPRNFEPRSSEMAPTPEMASPFLATTPHREDVSALDRFNVHRCPTRRVFSGTGLELVTSHDPIPIPLGYRGREFSSETFCLRYRTLNCNKTTMYYSIDMNFFYSKDNLVALHFKYDFWHMTAMASSDVVQSGRPIFDDFFQHLWPYIGNNTANIVFQMVKRLWLIRIDQ
ncbi:adhesion G protein-coupled receptor B2 [Trichonephila clavipes]|nr:adhesion G protein-coupled receptor B2 [Trichonephila clavipes]